MVFDRLDSSSDSVLTHQFHYHYLKKYLDFKEITLHSFKMREEIGEFVFDIEDCIQLNREIEPKVILFTSPNNPTGNSLSVCALKKILVATNLETLVIVDESYWGFDENYDQQSFLYNGLGNSDRYTRCG